jgi:putative phosphoribosyl transferase
MRFKDRAEAGRQLADRLGSYARRREVLVLALPRGGVPVGLAIARALGAPLDVFVVCKLVPPEHPGETIGAAASGGVRFVHQPAVERLRVSEFTIQRIAEEAERELRRLEETYRGGLPPISVRDRDVVLVDDGVATGSTMKAAVLALRQLQPARLVAAVPVAPALAAEDLRQRVDELICLNTSEQDFSTVSAWYDAYGSPTEEEVRRMMVEHAGEARISPE